MLKKKILEEAIVKVIMQGLVACRIPVYRVQHRLPFCFHCHKPSGMPGTLGIPDLIGWIPAEMQKAQECKVDGFIHKPLTGRALFIEVKRPVGGVASIEQRDFIQRAMGHGCIAFFARGWDDVADRLRAAGVKIPAEV